MNSNGDWYYAVGICTAGDVYPVDTPDLTPFDVIRSFVTLTCLLTIHLQNFNTGTATVTLFHQLNLKQQKYGNSKASLTKATFNNVQ